MLKLSLLQEMLVVSIAMSTISCAFVQKTKKYFKSSKFLAVYDLFINTILGIMFCISFTNINFPESLWIGLFGFLGSDTLYKSLEGKMSSYTDLMIKNIIEVSKDNLINTGSDM